VAIPDDGGIALLDMSSNFVDQVGMCSSTLYHEMTNLAPLSGMTDRSYERLPGGSSGSCQDMNNNSTDFQLIAPSDPQNSSSPAILCAGVMTDTPTDTATDTSTSTATSTATATPTSTLTPVPTAACSNIYYQHSLLINEVGWMGTLATS